MADDVVSLDIMSIHSEFSYRENKVRLSVHTSTDWFRGNVGAYRLEYMHSLDFPYKAIHELGEVEIFCLIHRREIERWNIQTLPKSDATATQNIQTE